MQSSNKLSCDLHDLQFIPPKKESQKTNNSSHLMEGEHKKQSEILSHLPSKIPRLSSLWSLTTVWDWNLSQSQGIHFACYILNGIQEKKKRRIFLAIDFPTDKGSCMRTKKTISNFPYFFLVTIWLIVDYNKN